MTYFPDLASAIEGTAAPADHIAQLELVPVDFIDFSSEHAVGQLVVASALAGEVQEIFGDLRDARFPIFSIIPIVHFDHDDHQSIGANNTSAFNYRVVAGTDRLSQHSFGRAIDINPLLNPYLNIDLSPKAGSFRYPEYDTRIPGTIVAGGIVVKAFEERGWTWGGSWTEDLDFQHLYKP